MGEYLARYFSEKKMADAWVIIQEDFLSATVSTLYITIVTRLEKKQQGYILGFSAVLLLITLMCSGGFRYKV